MGLPIGNRGCYSGRGGDEKGGGGERGGGGFYSGKGGGGSGRCGYYYGICIGRVGEKSMGDSESIRNLFEQVGQGRGKLTINGLCLSR